MKLISKDHDYYDGAGMGVDETVIFVRKPREILDAPFDIPDPSSSWSVRRKLTFKLIVLGGELFPYAEETFGYKMDGLGLSEEPTRFHYDKESTLAALKEIGEQESHRVYLGIRNIYDDIERHFSQSLTKEQTDWLISNRVVTGRAYQRSIFDQKAKRHFTHIQMDADVGDLKDSQLYKVVDPATAHMRISNFIGGVLPHGPETVEISDKHKIQKAGHDPVTSFRTPKGAKKPRRKKA